MDVRATESKIVSRQRSSSVSSTSNANVQLRVLSAGTGVCYPISLHPNELTVANLRRHLAAAVPPHDQILLLGPPYKVPKDSTLRSEDVLASLRLGDEEDNPTLNNSNADIRYGGCALTTPERTGARRLFLFSKQDLSDAAPQPPPCTLEPQTIKLPTTPDPSPVVFPTTSSPLHQALEVYERRFMLHLCRGRALADGADMRLASCRTCVAEQSVMARSLRAAVSNLADHRNAAARTRTEFTSDFQAKIAKHANLLERFERYLGGLEGESLHPALIAVAKNSGRMMESLLDTVPVEKEKAWAGQCRTGHDHLMKLFGEIDAAFTTLNDPAAREEEARMDREAEEEVTRLSQEVDQTGSQLRILQAERLDRLTRDHGEVVRVVVTAISGGSDHASNAQAAFTRLEEMSNASESVLPSMESDDVLLADLMKRVAGAKTREMLRMRSRLRQVSAAQSNIQRVLSSLTVLKDALTQQCENMVHLEHVAELKMAYKDFLSEIRRRRAYGNCVTSTCAAMMERLANMRSDEVKSRERFLRGPGRHLMPPFYEIFVPTLATPPPLFTPQLPAMVEMDTLPDVGESVHSQQTDSTMNTTKEDDNDNDNKDSINRIDVATQATEIDANNEQSLIVSADTSNELMDTCTEERMAADAELKTLSYENAVLRQALERMGGKPPRSYIDAAKEKDKSDRSRQRDTEKQHLEELSSFRDQITKLEKELSDHKKAAAQLADDKKSKKGTTTPTKKEKKSKQDDKISHSSFSVGDVGLFMPTGRGSGGKRTYLAFHSNCPHRYLSPDSIAGTPDYVLGRIVYQEELVAGPLGSDCNPFGLHVGTKFWVLTVEVLKVP